MNINIEQLDKKAYMFISGNIRNNTEVSSIKSHFADLSRNNMQIRIIFNDSYIMPSSLIGFLLKVIHEDKFDLDIEVKKDDLYNLLARLNLVKQLNVIRSS